MKVTIEKINGKDYTVVWAVKHTKYDDSASEMVDSGDYSVIVTKGDILIIADCNRHIATALPALPRYPTKEDARLLREYIVKGIFPTMVHHSPYGSGDFDDVIFGVSADGRFISYSYGVKDHGITGMSKLLMKNITITHCLDEQGNRVDVAIKEGE